MTQLDYLGLQGNDVSDMGLALAGLTNLTGLFLGETQVTDAGLGHLKRMTRLNRLWLYDTPVTAAGVAEIAEP